jgi:Rieske Fe-S protein
VHPESNSRQPADADVSADLADRVATVRPTRRTLLLAGVTAAGAAGAAALAGCSGGSGSGGAVQDSTTPGAGAGSTGSGTSSGTSSGTGTPLAKVSDVPVGNAISAKLGDQPILISQPQAGTIVAFTAICTHMGCTVRPAGKEFHCPCHGSVYNAATGEVIHGPAPRSLAKIPTKVVDGEVMFA